MSASWRRMLFRGDPVWVRVGADGRLALDGSGRAEMKYRESDSKSYRPAAGNLTAAPDSGEGPDGPPSPPAEESAGAGAEARRRPSATRKPSRSAAGVSALPRADGGALEVWTDGACSGNPGPMGIGVVVIDGTNRHEIGDYLGHGTNNIAELVAIERGLELAAGLARDADTKAGPPKRRFRVYSDSGYAIGLLDKGWKAKANQDVVARIRRKLAAMDGIVEFVKVPGHAGVPENERCDALARAAISHRQRVA
jgi:ribonuclease HI